MMTGYNNTTQNGARRGSVRVVDHRFKGANRQWIAKLEQFDKEVRIWRGVSADRFTSEAEADAAVKKFLE